MLQMSLLVRLQQYVQARCTLPCPQRCCSHPASDWQAIDCCWFDAHSLSSAGMVLVRGVGVDANPGLCNACEPQECMNECPANTVFARNDRGCEVCDCCEVPVCNNVCNLGTRRNELGCPSCECCPSLDACNLECPAGFVTDATGCAICECSDEEVIIREREN